MYRFAVLLMLLPLANAAAENRGGDFAACTKGQAEVAAKAAKFHGEDRIGRLIQADITRSKKEENEGDADECIEALDHAKKLLAGQY